MKNASLSVAFKKEHLSSIWGIAQLGVLFFQTLSSGAFISISGEGSERKDCIVLKSMSCQQEDPSIKETLTLMPVPPNIIIKYSRRYILEKSY